ncbi:uncharacterized protein EAF01_008360 [Botrytis porri]|uniref:Uncharacterized protein n=1 Tax=Botrytis porri TaxID=87229 RepID=A0A4Z1L6U8_9HELO|nr:uncharacterized protein EAF01_008360 [Botrytis porri]KAF7899147.1 hypothetical protein EAF01_008360 [Botrytis porri]TGO92223.1 hypothetical protein BPOR_0007g00070 [Botrytis porri]
MASSGSLQSYPGDTTSGGIPTTHLVSNVVFPQESMKPTIAILLQRLVCSVLKMIKPIHVEGITETDIQRTGRMTRLCLLSAGTSAEIWDQPKLSTLLTADNMEKQLGSGAKASGVGNGLHGCHEVHDKASHIAVGRACRIAREGFGKYRCN